MATENRFNIGDLVTIPKKYGHVGGGTYVVVSAKDPATVTLRECVPDQRKGKPFRIGRKNVQLTHRSILVGDLD